MYLPFESFFQITAIEQVVNGSRIDDGITKSAVLGLQSERYRIGHGFCHCSWISEKSYPDPLDLVRLDTLQMNIPIVLALRLSLDAQCSKVETAPWVRAGKFKAALLAAVHTPAAMPNTHPR